MDISVMHSGILALLHSGILAFLHSCIFAFMHSCILLRVHHCKLTRSRRPNLIYITVTTLWLRYSSSSHFMHKCKKENLFYYILWIQNIFDVFNKRSSNKNNTRFQSDSRSTFEFPSWVNLSTGKVDPARKLLKNFLSYSKKTMCSNWPPPPVNRINWEGFFMFQVSRFKIISLIRSILL